LTFGSEQSEFTNLVQLITSDVTPAAVLSELERIQSVKRTANGLELIENTFVPKGDPEHGFKILAEDIADLVLSVEENVLIGPQPPHMHFRTEYDRIDPAALPEIKQWLLERGRELHLHAREFLSRYDLDINPERASTKTPVRVTLSSHSFTAKDARNE
jgi:hypothetical protein